MSKPHLPKMLRIAAEYSKGGSDRNYHIGCAVKRKDGAFVFSRNNRTKVPEHNAHAEVRALKKADWGSTLWVARVTNVGRIGCARPCPRCQAYIVSKGVKKVLYSISDTEYGIWYPGKTELGNVVKKKCNKNPGFQKTIWSKE